MQTKCALLVSSIVLAACAGTPADGPSAAAALKPADGPSAVATLKATQGNAVTGTATFTQKGDKVLVQAEVAGLTPGMHGFHIHEKGDCSAPDATSAGGHFNPAQKPHGSHTGSERHGGDLGNLNADASGKAKLTIEVDSITTAQGAARSIIGRGLIVHADPDDFKTQPTGNSGKRVACAVIASK